MLQSLYATRDLRRAVVVDKALPTVRQQRCREDVQLLCREERCWRVRCGRLAGSRIPARDVGQQAHRPRRHGFMVTAACVDASAVRSTSQYCLSPVVFRVRCLQAAVQGHYPAGGAIHLGPVHVAASSLLHRGGRVERGSLQQCLLALPWGEGGRGRLREALCALALWVRVVRVLPAMLRGRLREEEESVQVAVALRGGLVVECQPLSNHASRMCGHDAALQSQAGQVVRRARRRNMGLRV